MKQRKLVLILAVIMAFSTGLAINVPAISGNDIVAYAASLSAPSVTVKSASYSSAKINWKKISAAKKYIVYRSTKKSSGFKAIKTITKNTTVSYTDKGLTCGKTYYYKVTAVSGSSKKTSSVKSVKIVPATPSSVTLSSAKCGVNTVKYSSVSGASGYQIYYSATKSGTYKCLKTTTAKSYAHKIGSGKKGYYKVRAYKTINGKKVYGKFSSIKSITAMAHKYGAYYVTVAPTCATDSKKVATCKTCGAKSKKTIPADPYFYEHDYSDYTITKAPSCTEKGVESKICRLCGKTINRELACLGHNYGDYEQTLAPTCTENGAEERVCSRCGDKESREIDCLGHDYGEYEITGPPSCAASEDGTEMVVCGRCGYEYYLVLPHTVTTDYIFNSEGVFCYVCSECGNEVPTRTCVINLDNAKNINYPEVAVYNELENKLTLKGTEMVDSFELIGTTDVSITVNAHKDTEVKLCGVNITTNAADCIRTNNKAPIDEATGLRPSVTVSISAKDGTENTLKAITSGNAIESETRLELKGHGVLNANTTSTAINCVAKMWIKNLTLNITSGNRGIDTKNLVAQLDVNGNPITDVSGNPVYSTEYYNISIGANAVITINSNDDGIRCKNMEFEPVDKTCGDTDTTITITSAIGDGIQIEGKTGITMNSGFIKITAGKRAFNCTQDLLIINTDEYGNPLGSYEIVSCSEEFKA